MPVCKHRWDLSPKEALALQKELAAHIILEPQFGPVKSVAGIDVGVRGGMARAAAVVLDFPGLEVMECAVAVRPVAFPYIPGLLSFREGPVILEALGKLTVRPDLIIFDGQGQAHPRRLGIASHIGLLANLPAIGCAKSRLCGEHDEPDLERGSLAPLVDSGETIGAVVRTRSGVKPVFVSPGHRVDLPASVKYVLACCKGFRLPETTRWAHRVASEERIMAAI
ncbi:MAG: deoxyribonuclease V [Deltaproteobacteria bacterium]|nr:deoxyribonuclease V [Deltaproteobacteria bacterium]